MEMKTSFYVVADTALFIWAIGIVDVFFVYVGADNIPEDLTSATEIYSTKGELAVYAGITYSIEAGYFKFDSEVAFEINEYHTEH